MNYIETTNWLFNQLPMYQTKGAIAYKADLSNTLALCNHLNNPHRYFKSIHIAGTNGKGSTSSMLASILQEAGYKVGLFTSPHLKDFRERIKINGKPISKEFVVSFVEENKTFFEVNSLSFFEMTSGLAFSFFANQKVDVAIFEVGMGGRLDSTNVIDPILSIITNIGLDHQQFLGNSLQEIATEKAGIIKSHVPVVIGEYVEETKPVFERIATEKLAEIHFAQDKSFPSFESDLKGDYQEANKNTVLTAVSMLRVYFSITNDQIIRGLLKVVKNTGLLGRWQILNQHPFVVCDTAHNAHGLSIVMNQLKNVKYDNLHIVLGVVNDKNLNDIFPLFPKNAKYYFAKPNVLRGLDETILSAEAKKYDLFGDVYTSVKEAYDTALQSASSNDAIYVGGSTFVVAEIV
ncbi:bifunctional folylpolyglutamate synthase/dihydrofolate synthase [Flavobacterium chuncheonense]|uniref:Dihydrofolate synthase/folylpolyglutamate synthase n=1 Tax=Flavobacterium chuncheonense TaxID=2026653 RepID=A0ABW5YJE5_9FLAO